MRLTEDVGVVYFSQAHALRWLTSPPAKPSKLYREILTHALFYDVLVISDSHALQNLQFLEMLPGGIFSHECMGIEELLRQGVIRIAHRIGMSLTEIVQDQIDRQVPVTKNGSLQPIDRDFLKHAERLQRLVNSYEYRFETTEINLARMLREEILDRDAVRTAYDIHSSNLRTAIGTAIDALLKRDGVLHAAALFNFADVYPNHADGLLATPRNNNILRRLATSAHAISFVIAAGIPPVISPHSDDYDGASALYKHFLPSIIDEEPVSDEALKPELLIRSSSTFDIAAKGIQPLLNLRGQPEFMELQQARSDLLVSQVTTAPIQRFEEALAKYMLRVALEYGGESISDESNRLLARYLVRIEDRRVQVLQVLSQQWPQLLHCGVGGAGQAISAESLNQTRLHEWFNLVPRQTRIDACSDHEESPEFDISGFTLAIITYQAVSPQYNEDRSPHRDLIRTYRSRIIALAAKLGLCSYDVPSDAAGRALINWLVANKDLTYEQARDLRVDHAIVIATPRTVQAKGDMSTPRPTDHSLTKADTLLSHNRQAMESCEIILFAANPAGTGKLALDKEVREIESKIRASDHRDNLKLFSKWAVRPDDLLQALNQHDATIIHFSGHGSAADEIILEGNDGQAKPVSKAAMSALLKTLRGMIRLVILNACFSRPQAEGITEHIDCAIGMNKAIGDEAAIIFAASVYRAIGFGKSVQEAFDQGIAALLLEGILEENTPELLCKAGVDATQVYLLNP